MVRAPRQASGSSMNGYSVFNMPFSSYGKGNSTGIGRAINDKANSRAQRINTRLGAYYKADTAYRAQVADQQKVLAIRAANAKRVADANFGVDLYNEIGTGLAGLANMIVPGLGFPIQAVVSGTTPAFRQLAGGDQTFRPSDVTKGLSNLAPLIQWAGPQLYQAAIPAGQAAAAGVAAAYQNITGFGGAQYGRVKGHVSDIFNFGPATDSQREFAQRVLKFQHQPSSKAYKDLWLPTGNKSIEWLSGPGPQLSTKKDWNSRFDFLDLIDIEPNNYRPEDFSPRPTKKVYGPLAGGYNFPGPIDPDAIPLLTKGNMFYDPDLGDYIEPHYPNLQPDLLDPVNPLINPYYQPNIVDDRGFTSKTFRRARPIIPNENIYIDLDQVDPILRRSSRNNIFRGGFGR